LNISLPNLTKQSVILLKEWSPETTITNGAQPKSQMSRILKII